MNYSVPEFEADDGGDYSIPTSSRLSRKIKSPRAGEDEMMELVWENGQIVLHGQNQRSKPGSRFQAAEIRPEEELPAPHNDLFMEEDEMTDWLHYPLAHDLISDLDYPAPTVTETPAADVREPAPSSAVETGGSYRPPVRPTSRPEAPQRFQNFALFSRYRGRAEPGQGSSNDSGREFTVAESNETPAPEWWPQGGDGAAACAEKERCQVASSGVGAEPMHKPPVEDRKRKGREADVSNCHSEPDVDFDSPDAKRQGCGPVKKSRAAEVHNLSERKRRDRINEKMKALQELIPHSNKTDKASMLDEAIEYLKSLQLQVQHGSYDVSWGAAAVHDTSGYGDGNGYDGHGSPNGSIFLSSVWFSIAVTSSSWSEVPWPRLSYAAFSFP